LSIKPKKKLNISIEDYTIQLVAYRFRRNRFMYINAKITNYSAEARLNWKEHGIMWCDDNSSSWGAVYDIEKNRIISFQTNGPNVQNIMEL
jgi:hypothetical protein